MNQTCWAEHNVCAHSCENGNFREGAMHSWNVGEVRVSDGISYHLCICSGKLAMWEPPQFPDFWKSLTTSGKRSDYAMWKVPWGGPLDYCINPPPHKLHFLNTVQLYVDFLCIMESISLIWFPSFFHRQRYKGVPLGFLATSWLLIIV